MKWANIENILYGENNLASVQTYRCGDDAPTRKRSRSHTTFEIRVLSAAVRPIASRSRLLTTIVGRKHHERVAPHPLGHQSRCDVPHRLIESGNHGKHSLLVARLRHTAVDVAYSRRRQLVGLVCVLKGSVDEQGLCPRACKDIDGVQVMLSVHHRSVPDARKFMVTSSYEIHPQYELNCISSLGVMST